MSTITLNNRAAGQTIQDTFFNDIHSALDGDFVGRNSSGVPTAGQNLGTAAIPWGTGRFNSVIIGGSAVDTSQIISPLNRVVSGKMRSSSNQPAFITPAGGSAAFTLAAALTNLVLDIDSTAVTVTTDIVKSGLTTAPSSQNTCLVNDASAVDQESTRYWGEFGSEKDITVDTMGTNISALVGKFACFSVFNGSVTEYFLGFVESTTKISRCYRGFFLNSSLAPMNRAVFSDNDVITLMSTAWIFVENNATTVDVTYTNPTWSFTAPNSPATGDYWYDMGNNTWKRYDGVTFQVINRTFVGIAIIDTSNCVGARCADFYYPYSDDSTIDVALSTTEIIRGNGPNQRVKVAGSAIEFKYSFPQWNITTDLAGAADMNSATEQASTRYYLYIKDDGDTVISDIGPYYRADFAGTGYHPHNPWRFVGEAYNDGSSNLVFAFTRKKLRDSGQWVSDTGWTFSAGFGTVSNTEVSIQRRSDSIRVRGRTTVGTPTTTQAYIVMPAWWRFLGRKFPQSVERQQAVGTWYMLTQSATPDPLNTNEREGALFVDKDEPDLIYLAWRAASNQFLADPTNGFIGANSSVTFDFEIPIVGLEF